MVTWCNWAGNVQARPRAVAAPASIEELRTVLRTAAGGGVRVAGSGHSFSPLCDADALVIDLAGIAGVESVDPVSGEAWVLAGTKIHALGEPLLRAGRALANQGDIDRQAIAGAVATGTHGTGRRHGSLSSLVGAMEVMSAGGELITIDGSAAPELRRAAALNLGLLGVMTRLRLVTVPAYKLRERSRPLPFEQCLRAFPGIEREHRNAEFWWVPAFDTCAVKTLAETGDPSVTPPDEEHPPGTMERYLKPEKVDWSYRVYPSVRSVRFVECEHTLPIANGPDAVRAVRALIRERHPYVQFSVEYRTLAGEDHLLSPTQGADSATISVHQDADKPWQPFMRDADALLREHGGRPHWGKLHWTTRDDMEALYPHAETFRRVRRGFDPHGMFLNDHLRAYFA